MRKEIINKYVTWEQYERQEQRIQRAKHLGVEFIYNKSKAKVVLGCVCLVIAIVPNGLGIICYPLAFSLFASSGIDIYGLIRVHKHTLRIMIGKLKHRWIR